ncbi:unnamed protein product [Didymodactylos carnosus]|uniref:Uncharacterized protein n=1 Tax=Didymodactylos carnosus TaxID=1234261 RepID=A0A8S2FT35_9BILA|nr:unnamed protein product [Didymodactylos carnosus]CAF4337232.1 unnamed protein product [Didymodactylos carnosus]
MTSFGLGFAYGLLYNAEDSLSVQAYDCIHYTNATGNNETTPYCARINESVLLNRFISAKGCGSSSGQQGCLYNTTERLQNMLGISHGALYRLKNEMHNLQLQATAQQHQEETDDDQPSRHRTRSETSRKADPLLPALPSVRKRPHSAVSSATTASSSDTVSTVPVPLSPKKKGKLNFCLLRIMRTFFALRRSRKHSLVRVRNGYNSSRFPFVTCRKRISKFAKDSRPSGSL